MIEVPEDVYKQLIKDSEELKALHEGGVDNWEYYYDSLKDAGFMDKYYGD